MITDPIEVITLIFAFIAFIFIAMEVAKSSESSPQMKKFWACFLAIAGFILANRFFTNAERYVFPDVLNLLEHMSMAGASFVFFYVTCKMNSSKWKLPQ